MAAIGSGARREASSAARKMAGLGNPKRTPAPSMGAGTMSSPIVYCQQRALAKDGTLGADNCSPRHSVCGRLSTFSRAPPRFQEIPPTLDTRPPESRPHRQAFWRHGVREGCIVTSYTWAMRGGRASKRGVNHVEAGAAFRDDSLWDLTHHFERRPSR